MPPPLVHPAVRDTLGNVITPALAYKAINNQTIIPFLVGALQEMAAREADREAVLDSLLREVHNNDSTYNQLQNQMSLMWDVINQCCNISQGQHHSEEDGNVHNHPVKNVENIRLAEAQTPVLYQNEPNPFSREATIRYYLPEDVVSARIVFHDQYGRVMNEVVLEEHGRGAITVQPDDLAEGVYTYSLMTNDKVIDTKRMVYQR